MSFVQLLSEARKYKLFLAMAEQSTAQQAEQRLVDIILDNVGTVVCFRAASPANERFVLPLFTPYIDAGEIASLPAYSFYIRFAALKVQEPISGETVLLEDEQAKMAGVLHDIVEDTPVTFSELKIWGCPKPVIDAVKLVTHSKDFDGSDEAYMRDIQNIADSGNQIAIDVKWADLTNNQDLSRIPNPTEKDHARLRRYERAKKVLRPLASQYLLNDTDKINYPNTSKPKKVGQSFWDSLSPDKQVEWNSTPRQPSPNEKLGLTFQEWSNQQTQKMIGNLNYNVKLDHIDYVDHGVRPMDKDYLVFKREFIILWGKDKYEQESLNRENLVEKLYHTDWKSKRISDSDKLL